MTFDENETMNPDGTNISASQAKKMQNEIEALRETVSTLADRLNALSSEVTTSQLNADNADISDAKISNADVDKVTADEAEITALSGDTATVKVIHSNSVAADEATVTNAVIQSVTANSVNSESYTGESVNVESVKAGEAELDDITAESVKTDTLEVSGNAEIKGALTQRGNINFPENGDIIQGEYLEVHARKLRAKSLTTETPKDSTNLVGYDNQGNLIPVDATLDPGNFWKYKEGDNSTIETKDDKNIDVANITCDDLTAEGDITVTGDITATGDVSCDNASVTTDATVGGDVTVSEDASIGGDASVTGDISGDNITASGKVQGDNADFANDVLIHGDLYVGGVEHVVQEENIISQNDFITLRANNSASLGSNKSGLLINNYNGSDSLAVVTDGDGTLRVGTGVGTETTYNDIYYDSASDKWYTDIEDPTSEVTPSGSLVKWDSVSESGTVTHYVNAVFKAIDFSQGTLEPVLTREEDADLNDQGLLKYNHAEEKADTLPLPTAPKSILGASVNNGNVSYSWDVNTDTSFICTSADSAASKTIEITGLTSLYVGLTVKVLFQNKNTYSGDTFFGITNNGVTVGLTAPIKVYKAGALQSLIGHNGYWLDRATKTFEVWQAGTILELMWNGTYWVVIGNPLLESWSAAWNNGQIGYKVFADGFMEVWDVYYVTDTLQTITYEGTSYTYADEFKIEFANIPIVSCSPAAGGTNTTVQQSEFIQACCPIAWRRPKGTSNNWNAAWYARGY